MKLVFYSGDDAANIALDQELIRLTGKQRPTVTFIPASHDDAAIEFEMFRNHFLEVGVGDCQMLELDNNFSLSEARAAINVDLIYLGGGNTFHFLRSMRRSGFFDLLRYFARHGGVIAGQSAGSILMTPNISTASYPKFDCDDNYDKVKDFDALHLVNFEFFPHYSDERDYSKELKKQSKDLKYPIYAATDGSGIVISPGRVLFLGEVWSFSRGKKHKISV